MPIFRGKSQNCTRSCVKHNSLQTDRISGLMRDAGGAPRHYIAEPKRGLRPMRLSEIFGDELQGCKADLAECHEDGDRMSEENEAF